MKYKEVRCDIKITGIAKNNKKVLIVKMENVPYQGKKFYKFIERLLDTKKASKEA